MVPSENDIFGISKDVGLNSVSKLSSLMICVGVASRVFPKSAWSPSYEKMILEIAKIWTTPVDGILLVYYKGINRGPLRDQ